MHGMYVKIQFKVLPRRKALNNIYDILSCITTVQRADGWKKSGIKVYTLYRDRHSNLSSLSY